MIVFDLKCSTGHRFEGWFQSSRAYDEQRDAGMLLCPVCGDCDVEKAPMAPKLRKLAVDGEKGPPQPSDLAASANLPSGLASELRAVMQRVRNHVEANCDYVGDRFADEARAMHYGETEERGIYGKASAKQAADLHDEGIEVLPLPTEPKSDA